MFKRETVKLLLLNSNGIEKRGEHIGFKWFRKY